ncbi:hypothetical protein J4409_01510 [Candidatus Woesearchaeota archaeon]|nr:hypothetical protein [Candidatus Woesearchaeota archaeon]
MLEELISCAGRMGINLSDIENSTKQKYTRYIEKGRLSDVKALRELTGINLSAGAIQRGYQAYVREGKNGIAYISKKESIMQ